MIGQMLDTYLIVGLGNPGRKYRKTRHNIGYMAVDTLLTASNSSLIKTDFYSEYAEISIDNNPVIVAKPQTFMNNSGLAVYELVHYFKINLNRCLIIYDDVDLSFGRIKIKGKGSSGGHNGLESIIQHLDTTHFARLRLGIGSDKAKKNMIRFVLSGFSRQERNDLDNVLEKTKKAVNSFIVDGLDKTMNLFNTKQKQSSYQEE